MIRRLLRGLIAVVAIAILIAAATFLADHPGRVDIAWRGWEIETSVGVLAAAALAGVLAVVLALRLLWLLAGGPRAFLRRRRARRRQAGLRALARGMIAVAAGEGRLAQRHAREADRLLGEPPLTLLLSAEAARVAGDEAAEKRFLTAMLDRSETELVGLRGLLDQALRGHDQAAARRLAERARQLNPSIPWASERLFELEAREGRWDAARATLVAAERQGAIPKARARHHIGVCLYELSRAAEQQGDRRKAIALAAEAHSLAPDLGVLAAHHARLLLQDARVGPAARAIERAWRTAPVPELAEAYATIYAGETAVARVRHVERLATQNPGARESHLAAAEAALEARLWGEARRHLDRAQTALPPPLPDGEPAAAGPTPRLYLLRARLAQAEGGTDDGAREWLDRIVAAVPDPLYLCSRCGGESRSWLPLCPHCGGFDTLAWRTPGRGAVAARLARPLTRPALPSAPLALGDAAGE